MEKKQLNSMNAFCTICDILNHIIKTQEYKWNALFFFSRASHIDILKQT